MAAEHHERSIEQHQPAERSHAELEHAAQRQLDHLRRHEHTGEVDADTRVEAAREAINRHHEPEPQPEPAPVAERQASPAHHVAAHLPNLRQNYAHTMTTLQRHLKPTSRRFSRFIHRPAVEKVSESLERTVARPSVTAGATWTALVVGTLFYFTARRYGYALSGSEMILSFAVGAVLGLILEQLWRLFVRRPRS